MVVRPAAGTPIRLRLAAAPRQLAYQRVGDGVLTLSFHVARAPMRSSGLLSAALRPMPLRLRAPCLSAHLLSQNFACLLRQVGIFRPHSAHKFAFISWSLVQSSKSSNGSHVAESNIRKPFARVAPLDSLSRLMFS